MRRNGAVVIFGLALRLREEIYHQTRRNIHDGFGGRRGCMTNAADTQRSDDLYHLDRFVHAQANDYAHALAEQLSSKNLRQWIINGGSQRIIKMRCFVREPFHSLAAQLREAAIFEGDPSPVFVNEAGAKRLMRSGAAMHNNVTPVLTLQRAYG